MTKKKIITLITCCILASGIIGSGTLISNKNMNVKSIQNHILLSAPDLNNLAVVINTNASPLVLYSSPNSNSSIESYISVGEMLNYQPTNNPNFYKVTVQETGASGYISADNMQIVESGLNKAYSNVNKNGQVINVTTNVKLMSSPDVHSQILGSYKDNTQIIVLGKQDQWYKVSIDGKIGYMYQEYVGIDTSSNHISTQTDSMRSGEESTHNNAIKFTNSGSGGNGKVVWNNVTMIPNNMIGKMVNTNPNISCEIFNIPSSTGKVLKAINKKSVQLKVLGQSVGTEPGTQNSIIWYKVKTSNGLIGYINQSLTYTALCRTNPDYKVNILNAPYATGSVLKTISYKEEPIYVINQVVGISPKTNQKEDYFEVSYDNHFTGFINIHDLLSND